MIARKVIQILCFIEPPPGEKEWLSKTTSRLAYERSSIPSTSVSYSCDHPSFRYLQHNRSFMDSQELPIHLAPPLSALTMLLPHCSLVLLYQLAFLTPGRFPARAFILKLYCRSHQSHPFVKSSTKLQEHLHASKHFHRIHTLDILKSLKIPLPFPPSIHRLRICVGRV